MTGVIAGVRIPDSKLALEAAELVRSYESEMLFNHSVRVYAFGIAESKADLVWQAIALHTTPGIPQFMRPEIALTNAGVLVDVVGVKYDEYTPEERDQVIAAFPRGDFKNEFVQEQTCSALKKPQTTFGTVNFDFIENHDPAFRKPNACADSQHALVELRWRGSLAARNGEEPAVEQGHGRLTKCGMMRLCS